MQKIAATHQGQTPCIFDLMPQSDLRIRNQKCIHRAPWLPSTTIEVVRRRTNSVRNAPRDSCSGNNTIGHRSNAQWPITCPRFFGEKAAPFINARLINFCSRSPATSASAMAAALPTEILAMVRQFYSPCLHTCPYKAVEQAASSFQPTCAGKIKKSSRPNAIPRKSAHGTSDESMDLPTSRTTRRNRGNLYFPTPVVKNH